jgi:hypothetical protein
MTDEEYLRKAYSWNSNLTDEQKGRMDILRQAALNYALAVEKFAPASRRRSLALTAIEEASSWAIKSITHDE